jgi:hypothetical protein
MQTEWVNILKNDLIPAQKKGGIAWRSTWQGAIFGDAYEWVTAYPITKFAQYDEPNPARRALGEEDYAKVLERLRKCMVGSRSYAMVVRQDLSLNKELTEPPAIAMVTTIRVMPGREPEYVTFLKNSILPVLRKAGVENYWVHQPIFGGDAAEWVSVTLYKKFADLDAGSPLVRVLGQEGTDKLLAKGAPFVRSVERTMARYRQDLSYQPAAQQ